MVYDVLMSRTNIDIEDRLIRKARRLTGLKTKKAVVGRALGRIALLPIPTG